MLITAYNLRIWILFVIPNIDVIDFELYILVVCFLPLNAHHLLDRLLDIKILEIMPKFIAFDL
tara:strand:+ start:190 stop:378 length:189 start_codon:yes stop_codon:yes gene_type:complete